MRNPHLIGIAAGAGAAVSWGSATVLSKDLLQDFDPVSLLLIQLAASVALLWCVIIVRGWRAGAAAPSLRGVASYAWLGALEPALAYFLFLWGLVATTASGATLIQASESIMIVGVTTIITRKFPSNRFLGLFLVALAALYCALNVEGDGAAKTSSPLGIALLSAGTFSAAIYVVLSGRVAHSAPALNIIAWQQSVALALIVLVVAVLKISGVGSHVVLAAVLAREAVANARTVLLCAACGLLQFAVPFSLYMIALQRLTANAAGSLLLLTPLVGLAEAHAFLGELLTARQWAGSAVALVAVAGLGFIGSHTEELHTPSSVKI
jgi:drug/metabolite transporter (DMT)-like permease